MVRRNRSILMLSFLLAATASFGQQGPDNEPSAAQGYVSNVFRSSSIDSVNLFNGQLTVPIAIGPAYPVGPKLKFQAMLVNNSNATELGHPQVGDSRGAYRPLHGDPALPVGWNFRIGKVGWCGSGICYFGPDGAEHVFADPAPDLPDGTPCLQTSDADQLLLCGPSGGKRDLFDGDGNHYVFDWVVSGYDDPASDYIHDFGRGRDGLHVTSITDRFGNRILVDYYTNARPCAFTCASSPTHFSRMQCGSSSASWIPKTVRTQPAGGVASQVLAVNLNADQMIESFAFQVLAGGSRSTALWTLAYENLAFSRGDPNCRSTSLKTLAELRLPADIKGLTGIAGDARYEFSYDPYVALLTSLRLPTGALVTYDWGVYHFHHGRIAGITINCNAGPPPATAPVEVSYSLSARPLPDDRPGIPGPTCDPNDYEDLYLKLQVGVVARTVTGPGLASGTTRYTQYAFPFGERGTSSSRQPAQTLTVVLSPPDVNVRYRTEATLFWAAPRDLASRGRPGERTGAPIRLAVYDHDPRPDFTGDPQLIDMPLCGGNADSLCVTHAARVTSRTYEYDDPTNERGNRRLKTETTFYGPIQSDGTCSTCKQHTVTYSLSPFRNWEDNGRHYNVESHTGNLGNDARTITTTWTPFISPWLPNLFNRRIEIQGGSTSDRSLFFDPATGFLQAEILWDGSPSIRRIFGTCRYPDSSGNVLQEVTATSPHPGPPPSNPCPPTFASWPAATTGLNGDAFGKQLAHQRGESTQARWLKDKTPLSWYVLDETRDSLTGWVTASRDTAGLSTGYLYDSLGRLTRITPPGGEVPTNISYDTPLQTTATRTGGTGLNIWNQYLYDALGRLIRERRLMPAGAYAKRFTKFDGAGNEYFSSEWVSDTFSESVVANVATACIFSGGNAGAARPSSAPGTYRLCFDPFGRAQQIVGANHSSLTTISRTEAASPISWYSDTLEAVTTWCVNGTLATNGACGTGGANTTTVTRRDALARVTQVTEPGGDRTDYNYDVNGRLTTVTQGVQSRTFTYDMAGFLRSEMTPEKGTVTWGNYGSLGNPIQMTEGGLSHAYSYDPAGRLTGETVGSIRYRTYCFDGGACADGTPAFSGGTHKLGKLTRRIGYNPVSPSASRVTEDFTYSHATGRLSAKTTALSSAANPAVVNGASSPATEILDYNALGELKTYAHPRVAGSFVETPGYDAGLPVSLSANGQTVVSFATYQPSGALASYTTGNGIETTIAPDPALSGRPSRISSHRGSSTLFDSQTYTYDGAGNVLRIGPDAYAYDARSRLISATLSGLPTQSFTYDRYGNLTRLAAQSFDIDPAKNCIKPPTAYDSRGNLTSHLGQTFSYDSLNRQTRHQSGSADWHYLHTGTAERTVRAPAAYDAPVPRREAARYIQQARVLQGKGGRWPVACSPSIQTFPDVPCSDPDWGYIKKLYEDDISSGCGGGNFCPDDATTRRQVAVLLVKARYGSGFNPQAATGVFSDVPSSDPYARWIEQLHRDGVTAGCGGGKFCPDSPVTESQMLALIRYGGDFDFAPIRAGSTYTYRNSENRVVAEYLDSAVGRDNLYFGNLLVASFVSSPTAGTPGWQYYASDHLGTPRLVTDSSGSLSETRRYYPYGEEANASPTMQRIRFAAMERDVESNRYYDHARHHDFKLGRFLSPDKMQGKQSDPQSWNRYNYAANNPLGHIDPDGRAVDTALDIAFVAADIADIAASIAARERVSTGQLVALGGDLVGAAVPFVTGIGSALRRIAGSEVAASGSCLLHARLNPGSKKARGGIIVLGRGPKDRLERLAAKEGGRISTTGSRNPKEIFRNNYSDMRNADTIVQYMDEVPRTQKDVQKLGGAGQYSRAEAYMIDSRPDLREKTIRKFETENTGAID